MIRKSHNMAQPKNGKEKQTNTNSILKNELLLQVPFPFLSRVLNPRQHVFRCLLSSDARSPPSLGRFRPVSS